jgi:8-oxo-dGTP pyrophosphatase MutT (NUDIX family)
MSSKGAGSILPISIHNDTLFFLFGKENELAETPGFSDFGGGIDGNETPLQTAYREGAEELTGFLGDGKELEQLIQKNGGTYNISHGTYHMHLFALDYDENLPKYYNQNHRFLWNRMDKEKLEKTKLFEKSEIRWFSIEDMKTHKKEFRHFYQEIVDELIEKKAEIEAFVRRKQNPKKKQNSIKKMGGKRTKKTRKQRGGK